MTTFQRGDKVRIIVGPLEKVGRIGTVTIPVINGAIIRFDDGMATAVQTQHLELVERHKAVREGESK